MAKSKPMRFTVAMKHFFGLHEGQKLPDFTRELRALNDEDRLEFRAGLESEGYELIS